MPADAPYSGGTSAGAKLYAVDGDFTIASPCDAPEISTPFKGDSFPGLRDIVLLNSAGAYVNVPLGSGYNVQPFSANQTSIIIEQKFMVAQAYYRPLPLNTPYDPSFSIGWGNDYANLGAAFLVEESPLQNVGGGIVMFSRKYATLPPPRNEFESYAFTFPAVNISGDYVRQAKTKIVMSRVQYDYYVYDDLNLLSMPVFPNGHRLNASTGINPTGLILPEIIYFQKPTGTTTTPLPDTVEYNLQLDAGQPLDDTYDIATEIGPTIPSASQYRTWINKAEIVAEASSFGPGPWLGNIYQRKTRFVLAQ